jgi:hypothetical protein
MLFVVRAVVLRSEAVTSRPGARSMRTDRPSRQWEEDWRIAGPLRPRWVKSMASRKLWLLQLAMTSVETPASSAKFF